MWIGLDNRRKVILHNKAEATVIVILLVVENSLVLTPHMG
jgi:hypothetical protein